MMSFSGEEVSSAEPGRPYEGEGSHRGGEVQALCLQGGGEECRPHPEVGGKVAGIHWQLPGAVRPRWNMGKTKRNVSVFFHDDGQAGLCGYGISSCLLFLLLFFLSLSPFSSSQKQMFQERSGRMIQALSPSGSPRGSPSGSPHGSPSSSPPRELSPLRSPSPPPTCCAATVPWATVRGSTTPPC